MAASTRVPHLSVDERQARGKEARNQTPLSTHTGWMPAADRPDPVALLDRLSTVCPRDGRSDTANTRSMLRLPTTTALMGLVPPTSLGNRRVPGPMPGP
jgi:hypothetical protein